MQFSDTSTRQGLIQDCEDLLTLGIAGISSNTNLLQVFTRLINQRYHQITTMILDSQDDWDFDDANKTDYPVYTTPLVAGQRDYTFPTTLKILKIKRVDITYDNSTYYKAEPWDSGETGLGLGNDTNTDARFSKTAPFYDLKANSLWIYPMAIAADVTAGGKVRIEFYREITEFATSATTAVPGFDTPFHRILSIGAALDYSIQKNLPAAPNLAVMYADMEKRLRTYYGKKDDDVIWGLKSAYTDYN